MNLELLELAAAEAGRLARRWPGVERDDIKQEILLWCVENGLDGSELPAGEPESDEEAEEHRQARRAVRLKLRDAGAAYCRRAERDRRRERAAVRGYDPADEAFYSLTQLRELAAQYFASGITERPAVGRDESVRRISDPAEGGTWLASLIDVERALKAVPEEYRWRLWDRLGRYPDITDEEYGWTRGLTEAQVRGRLRTALQALQRELGGQSPWNRGPTPRAA